MPIVVIHMAEGRTQEQKKNLLQALTRAVNETIDAPVSSIRVRIEEFSPDEYMIGGELMSDLRVKGHK